MFGHSGHNDDGTARSLSICHGTDWIVGGLELQLTIVVRLEGERAPNKATGKEHCVDGADHIALATRLTRTHES